MQKTVCHLNSQYNGSNQHGSQEFLSFLLDGIHEDLPARTSSGASDGKMTSLNGPKHKRGDMDCQFNSFAGTCLEDLQGEIPVLCKEQHGCRHFADLIMTDPFGNYLCQKLLEYSTDEQRNVICDSIAQDLVNISLNMHGTHTADARYNTQIHSFIVALSLYVMVLIKDLNGNHVIQKCLNKLAPEDNQACVFSSSSIMRVAANCIEVATHHHSCCVLQRCVDHASDHQRILRYIKGRVTRSQSPWAHCKHMSA
ncbi:armadillo-type protein [Mycena olivaceomarginata]|nr:armadillo-type protein [Mycena olivaceomarginata]